MNIRERGKRGATNGGPRFLLAGWALAAVVLLAAASSCGKEGHDHEPGEAGPAAAFECPMHPDFTSADPEARCPECGMKVSPKEGTESKYTCPMHPEFTSAKADDRCPECGMKLVPKVAGDETREGSSREGRPVGEPSATKPRAEPAGKALYHCPMHPTYTSDRPGECPICGMDLVPVGDAGSSASGVAGQATVRIDPSRQQQIGMRFAEAGLRPLSREIRTVGRIAYDPELFSAQEEFLTSVEAHQGMKGGANGEFAERASSLVESSRLRLRLLGLSDRQIDELARRGRPDRNLLLGVAGGRVWLYADIYEFEFGQVNRGQEIEATTLAHPGRVFRGEVVAIDSIVNPRTRSARVRARLENPKGLLKPDMFMSASIAVDLGPTLAIPSEAVMYTGTRRLVFIDAGEGRFEPREVVLGLRAGDFVQVIEGLEGGERLVVSGNFLLDSESKLKAALAEMTGGHDH